VTTEDLHTRRLKAQYDLSRVLAASSSLESAAGRILEIVGKSLECGFAEMWVLDRGTNVLTLAAAWSERGTETNLAASARQRVFRRGEGLPGTVLETGRPRWVRDVIHDPSFLRAEDAKQLGVHTAIAFPIQFAGETTGVIQFFAVLERDPEYELLETFADVGSQLGLFLERVVMSELVSRQQQDLLRLSMPVLRVARGVLLVPVIGALDAVRAAQAMDQIVESVESSAARVVLIDVTGVPHLDTAISQFLLDTFRATRLLGAEVVLTGVKPALAQTLVRLGVRLDDVKSAHSLADGLDLALASDPQKHRSSVG
jgi:anti-anti-sigma factor